MPNDKALVEAQIVDHQPYPKNLYNPNYGCYIEFICLELKL